MLQMQTSSQEITILPKQEAKMYLSCEVRKIHFFEIGIVLLLVPIVKHMEAITL